MVLSRLLITDEEDLTGIDVIPRGEFVMSNNVENILESIDKYLGDTNKGLEIAIRGKNKVKKKYCLENTIKEIFHN